MSAELGGIAKIAVFVFLVASMLSIGLRTRGHDLRALPRSGLLTRALLINFIVIPLLGILLARWLPLAPGSREAFILLACAPGGISALKFTSKSDEGQTLAFAGATAFLLAFLSLFVTPLLLAIALPGEVPLVPSGRSLLFVVSMLLVPIALGALLRSRSEQTAERLAGPFALAGVLAFLVLSLLTFGTRREAKSAVGSAATLRMALFVAGMMLIGWWAGGPARATRSVMASATSMRNAVLCLALVSDRFAGRDVQTPLVAFSAIMATPNMILSIVSALGARLGKRSAARKAAKGSSGGGA